MLPNSASSDNGFKYLEDPDHYFYEPIWLYPVPFPRSNPPSLRYTTNPAHYHFMVDPHSDESAYPNYWDGAIELEPNENISLSISGITNRIYNPDIIIELFPSYGNPLWAGYENAHFTFQIKCDGKSDGNFEFIADFPENPQSGSLVESISSTGEPENMTNGTIVLDISYTGSGYTEIHCGELATYIKVPFEIIPILTMITMDIMIKMICSP
jgi:hypothetical protein